MDEKCTISRITQAEQLRTYMHDNQFIIQSHLVSERGTLSQVCHHAFNTVMSLATMLFVNKAAHRATGNGKCRHASRYSGRS